MWRTAVPADAAQCVPADVSVSTACNILMVFIYFVAMPRSKQGIKIKRPSAQSMYLAVKEHLDGTSARGAGKKYGVSKSSVAKYAKEWKESGVIPTGRYLSYILTAPSYRRRTFRSRG